MLSSVPILLYHFTADSIPDGARRWNMPPKRFEQHIKHFRDLEYTPLTVTHFTQAAADGTLPKRPILVTFDDGTADFLTGALPILQKYSFPATLYITTNYIGATTRWLTDEDCGEMPMLTWDQVREIQASGLVEIGAHTETHPHLDIIPRTQAKAEITGSKQALEEQLQQSIHSFAYPHGHHDKHVRQLVIDAGYTSACAVKNALSAPIDDHFALSRLTIEIDMNLEDIDAFIAGEGMRIAPQKERLATTIYRWVRWFKKGLKHQKNLKFREKSVDLTHSSAQ